MHREAVEQYAEASRDAFAQYWRYCASTDSTVSPSVRIGLSSAVWQANLRTRAPVE